MTNKIASAGFTPQTGNTASSERRGVRPRVGLALACVLLATTGEAQTDPRTLPLWNESVTLLGQFTLPGPDGAGGMIDYGGRTGAFGVSQDGTKLYFSCSQKAGGPVFANAEGFAILTIPALGAKATVTQPCRGLGSADIAKIHPNPNEWRPQWGGIVEQNGKRAGIGYIEYDASGSTTASHWMFDGNFGSLGGPYKLTDSAPAHPAAQVKTGQVKSYTGRIPKEWQALLGGNVFSTAGYGSIVSRASYGPNFVAFNIEDLTRNNAPAKQLLGCPHEIAACLTWQTPTDLYTYNGAENAAGAFIIPGTRTLAFIERESVGPTCYGYATRNQAEHGQKYLDAIKCYSLAEPLDQKGPMGYPYVLVAKLYDLNELVAVKEGKKLPWEIARPYKVVTLPGSRDAENLYGGGGAFNEITGHYYLNRGHYGDNSPMQVYKFAGAGNPPVDCVGTWGAWTRIAGSESACSAAGSRTYIESRLFTVITSPAHGGLACPASPESRTQSEQCTPPPPALLIDIDCETDAQGVFACKALKAPPGTKIKISSPGK